MGHLTKWLFFNLMFGAIPYALVVALNQLQSPGSALLHPSSEVLFIGRGRDLVRARRAMGHGGSLDASENPLAGTLAANPSSQSAAGQPLVRCVRLPYFDESRTRLRDRLRGRRE